jgi:hypothetical protein
MSESTLQPDPLEARLLASATNTAVTRRRIWWSVLVPLAFITLLITVFWRDAQPRLLLWLFVCYVSIGLFERISYGIAVLGYKSVIRKLLAV